MAIPTGEDAFDLFEPTVKLADNEAMQSVIRQKTIDEITLEIEDVLIRNNVTFVEWQNICAKFMDRQMRVAETLSIKEAKERFNNLNQ